jgi:hypothetical protein
MSTFSARLEAGESEQGDDVRVVPLERHGEREDVELTHEGLRLDRQERIAPGEARGHIRLRREEDALAHDTVVGVEELWLPRH